MGRADQTVWSDMRMALWPGESAQAHADMIDEMLSDTDAWDFVAETAEGVAVAFAEVMVRAFANGCETRPVPFLGGIWVRDQFRRKRVGD